MAPKMVIRSASHAGKAPYKVDRVPSTVAYRWCPMCEASITIVDRRAGYCTQCGVVLTFKAISETLTHILRFTIVGGKVVSGRSKRGSKK